MTIIEQIKSEIERLKKNNEVSEDKDYAQYELDVACGYDIACDDILSFLSTLESEKPVLNDLEEAADKYEKENTGIYPEVGQTSIRDAFIDGAKWQKEQDDKLVDIIYQQGIEKGKDEMSETLKRKEK